MTELFCVSALLIGGSLLCADKPDQSDPKALLLSLKKCCESEDYETLLFTLTVPDSIKQLERIFGGRDQTLKKLREEKVFIRLREVVDKCLEGPLPPEEPALGGGVRLHFKFDPPVADVKSIVFPKLGDKWYLSFY